MARHGNEIRRVRRVANSLSGCGSLSMARMEEANVRPRSQSDDAGEPKEVRGTLNHSQGDKARLKD